MSYLQKYIGSIGSSNTMELTARRTDGALTFADYLAQGDFDEPWEPGGNSSGGAIITENETQKPVAPVKPTPPERKPVTGYILAAVAALLLDM